jgi:RIO kinase 1
MQDLNHIIEQAGKLNHKVEVLSNIKSGKEATVYRVMLDDQLVAMKVYKDPEERNFNNAGAYLLGKYYRQPSQRRAVEKNNKFAKKLKHENWVRREFFILQRLFGRHANIPKPILQINEVIFMELLGDADTVAPRLSDVKLTESEARETFDAVLKSVEIFWECGVVHADLSEFNILWWKSRPYIIDFPQSVDRRTHPNPRTILDRDLKNIVKYFSKYTEIDLAEVSERFSDA